MLGPRALPTTPRAFLLAWLQRLITCTLVAFVVVYPAIDAHYRDAHRRHYQVTILEPVPADVQTAHPHE